MELTQINQFVNYQKLVEKAISDMDIAKEPEELYKPVQYFLKLGGKRIRPVLCLMSCELFSGDVNDALQPGIGLELFHNFTLIHDDIMDNSKVRRGKETIHIKWDTNTAILAGDLFQVMALDYIMKTEPEKLLPALELFTQASTKVCEGQQWDMIFEDQEEVNLRDYIKMIELKTATLLAASLKLGAIIANANPNEQKLIYDYGIYLGTAFQIQDDILDTFGSHEKTGKKVGGDILAGKKTYLFIKALEKAEARQQKLLLLLLKNQEIPPDEKIKKMRDFYILLGVKRDAEKARDKYYENAILKLMRIPVDDNLKNPLIELSEFLMSREH